MKIIPSQDTPATDMLTPEEVRLLRAFRKLNDGCREFAFGFMDKYSSNPKCQRIAKKPALRVVKGGTE